MYSHYLRLELPHRAASRVRRSPSLAAARRRASLSSRPDASLCSPLVGAIAAGCTAIIKPAEQSQATAKLVAELVPKYLDSSAYRVVNGAIDETTALLKLQFDHIFYTGSSFVGRVIARAAAEFLTPTTLELGGKSPPFYPADEFLTLLRQANLLPSYSMTQTWILPLVESSGQSTPTPDRFASRPTTFCAPRLPNRSWSLRTSCLPISRTFTSSSLRSR